MLALRKSHERGHSNHGWLDSYHTFSFSNYYDPQELGFSALRVINEDRVAPGAGFATHSHQDMEIISYVLEGALQHKDSLGTGSVIRPGEVQVMSAGAGIAHSEFNASQKEPVHFLQIWIEPNEAGSEPAYQQKSFPREEMQGRLRVVVSPDGREGSLTIRQDAYMYSGMLGPGAALSYVFGAGRRAYVYVARGAVEANGRGLTAGDGIKIEEESNIHLTTREDVEVLLFDLP